MTPMGKELRALYAAMMDGWNRGSAEAFAAPFEKDLNFIAFDGTHFRERDELVRFHEPLFKAHLKGTRLVGDVTDIRFLGSDVAVLLARGGTIMGGRSTPAPERDSVQTLVAVKRRDGWRFVSFQNTRVRPIGQNALGTLCWLIGDWFWKWCLPRSVRLQPDHRQAISREPA
jgi:uncharacterized protein (TIGR02246 family)